MDVLTNYRHIKDSKRTRVNKNIASCSRITTNFSMNARKCVHAQMPLATPFRHWRMNQARSEEEKKKRKRKKEKERG